MKNSFITFALCMLCGQVHGASSNNDSERNLLTVVGKNVLVGDMAALIKVQQSTKGSSLSKVQSGPLGEINKYMDDLSWESSEHTFGLWPGVNAKFLVACIKKDQKVVAARIDDNRHTNCFQLRQIISDLQHQHGPQVPIQVHTLRREAIFSGVTGKLYSDAEEVTVFGSHDLAVYMKPSGMLIIRGHSGHFRTNVHTTQFVAPKDALPCNNMTMICDDGNKQVIISTNAPKDKPVTLKLDNFQGELYADGHQITVKLENSHCEMAVISSHATALFENTTIKGGVGVINHASLVLFRSNVTGPITGTSNSGVFKVNSTGTVRALMLQDGAQQCEEYTVSSEGNVAHVPALMAQEIARKNPDDTQKAADTVQTFDALWAQRQMPNHNTQEESKE